MLQATVDDDDQTTVPAIIDNVIVETKFTPQAAERLKTLLRKLGKSAYDIAIKIIGDIGSYGKENIGSLNRMCNLYSITTNQAAIIALFRVTFDEGQMCWEILRRRLFDSSNCQQSI